VKSSFALLLGGLALATIQLSFAQGGGMSLPKRVQAGEAFSIQTAGSGKAVLYIIGPGQVLRRDVQLGGKILFSSGTLYTAGHYLATLAGVSSTENGAFDVVPGNQPADLSFLAKPSRLPVGLHNGISGVVYVFDAYQNLITSPTPVSFELSNPSGPVQARTVVTRNGAAWTQMDSAGKEGIANFVARAGAVSTKRVIDQVPGDPCGLVMSARQTGQRLELETNPVRDCSGNPIPDGTIVTFTESYNGGQSTVDVPLKHGVARVEMPAYNGARISVASGVVLGNQIRWER
jgi:hypothetical protein